MKLLVLIGLAAVMEQIFPHPDLVQLIAGIVLMFGLANVIVPDKKEKA